MVRRASPGSGACRAQGRAPGEPASLPAALALLRPKDAHVQDARALRGGSPGLRRLHGAPGGSWSEPPSATRPWWAWPVWAWTSAAGSPASGSCRLLLLGRFVHSLRQNQGPLAQWPLGLGLGLGFPAPRPFLSAAPRAGPFVRVREALGKVLGLLQSWRSSDTCSGLPVLPSHRPGPRTELAQHRVCKPGLSELLWEALESLNPQGPEGQAGCRHLAALSEGSAVDKMTRWGGGVGRGRAGRLASDPASRSAGLLSPARGPSPVSAPGSAQTPALRVWDGWGPESPRG